MTYNRIRELRRAAGLTQTQLAKATGYEQSEISLWETSTRPISDQKLKIIAKALRCDIRDLFGESTHKIPISGFVSTFGTVSFVDTPHSTKVPPGMDPEKTSALLVKQSFPPFNAGWLFFYETKFPGVPHQFLNELCVVGLKDGQTFIRKITASEKPGQYNLMSIGHNEPEIKHAFVEFSAIITFMKRHEEYSVE